MTTIYAYTSHTTTIAVSIDYSLKGYDLEEKLLQWLFDKHYQIWDDLHMTARHSVEIEYDRIIFRGDDGHFALERLEIKEL